MRWNNFSIRGFTFVEVLVSVAIVALLTSLGAVSYSKTNQNSRNAKRRSDLEQIRSSLEMYRADNGYYPSDGDGGWTNVTNLSATLVDYIANIPSPPKDDEDYYYRALDEVGSYYYKYCLSAKLEGSDPADQCTPNSQNNYGVEQP